jgi:hypothetical protein
MELKAGLGKVSETLSEKQSKGKTLGVWLKLASARLEFNPQYERERERERESGKFFEL